MFFSTHARSVTILCRGDGLEKSMSRYLIDQIATRSNIERAAPQPRSWPRTARPRSRRSTCATPTTGETTRLESGGLFIFIGADAETGWLPPEIALDRRGYVLTGSDVSAAGRWTARPRPVPARDERARASSPAATSASGPVKRVAAAVGEGSMAIAFVHQYLREHEDGAAPAG